SRCTARPNVCPAFSEQVAARGRGRRDTDPGAEIDVSVAAPIATSRKVDPGLGFLLASGEPVVRHAALVDLLDRPHDDAEVSAARAGIDSGRIVAGLLAGQREDGGFGGHPYQKWGGAHWRLVSLMDLGVPPDTPGMREAAATVLRWLGGRHAHNASV